MPLVFMRSIPEFPEPVEKHGPCQGIFRLAFVEPDMNAPPQFGAADVLKQEQRPFNLSEFSQCYGQPILTRISAEFAEHQRRRHRAMLDRGGETEDFIPVADDLFPIDSPTDERRERLISGWLLHGIEARVSKVPDTWGKPKTKQMTQGEDVIGESGCVSADSGVI